ncbi:hypothetical protein KCP70_20115 [Salmonella enterica subsp. enterica]|nr:hypothetical protein KCP70_20115 [Salmonella enterica subsp. enterica]
MIGSASRRIGLHGRSRDTDFGLAAGRKPRTLRVVAQFGIFATVCWR